MQTCTLPLSSLSYCKFTGFKSEKLELSRQLDSRQRFRRFPFWKECELLSSLANEIELHTGHRHANVSSIEKVNSIGIAGACSPGYRVWNIPRHVNLRLHHFQAGELISAIHYAGV